ncbi:MAG: hypothetical protein HZA19_01445 [Nitrospirae bacterium]|nr:hypothetical protein [Nitrospirota bacterium]
MPDDHLPIDLSRVKTYSLKDRPSKVHVEEIAKTYQPGGSFRSFLETLPDILAAKDLLEIAQRIVKARRDHRPVITAIGAHFIKTGLTPLLIQLMEQQIITAVAMNGAGIIHDAELAMVGHTSEDVDRELGSGSFGMAYETAEFLNRETTEGVSKGLGLGAAIGQAILSNKLPNARVSLLATACRLGIPVTVHVAIGADIIHMHPSADGRAIGEASLRDFRTFCSVVSHLEGGVFLNMGSAVLLPEVFLKALNVVRNLGHTVDRFTTVNMDFIQHYRPQTNVVRRPTQKGGKGFTLTGHHEIMVPLLFAAVLEQRTDEARENR